MTQSQINNPMAVLSDVVNAPARAEYHAVVISRRRTDCRCRCSDFTDAVVETVPPGVPLPSHDDCRVLSLHNTLFSLNPLSSIAASLGFFRYCYPGEALHLSQAEYDTLLREMDSLEREVRYGVDQFSSLLIAQRVSVMLTLIARYFHRQFILRDEECLRAVDKVQSLVIAAYERGDISGCRLPDVAGCAARVAMSEAYFLDVLHYVKGQTFKEFANLQQLRTAKRLLADNALTVSQVADRLGFPSENCFSQFFTRVAGVSPRDYRLRRS